MTVDIGEDAGAGAGALPQVAGDGSLAEITRPFLQMLQAATGLESVYLTRVGWEEGEQEVLYSLNAGALTIPEGLKVGWSDTLCRRALLQGPARTSDVPTDFSDSQAARDLKLQTYVSQPVVESDDTIWGTICGASSVAVTVDDRSLAMVKQVAGLIAERISRERDLGRAARAMEREQARLAADNEWLHDAALTDHLTGIHNRRAFEERWRVELERARRYQFPVALLLLDLDGFKAVNDSAGHAAGDEALKQVTRAFAKQVRDIDLLARLGGDEFVVGLSHADALVGEHIFNRIKAEVAMLDPAGGASLAGVSGGIASSTTTPAPDLLEAADRALYSAKESGGNTSRTWHGDLPD